MEYQVKINGQEISFSHPEDYKWNEMLNSIHSDDIEDIVKKFSLEDFIDYHHKTNDDMAVWILDYITNPDNYIISEIEKDGRTRRFPAKVSLNYSPEMNCYANL